MLAIKGLTDSDCEFELSNTSFRAVFVCGDRHRNNAYWRACCPSHFDICSDSQLCRGHWQLRGILSLPWVANLLILLYYYNSMLTKFLVWIACSTTVNVAISFGGQSWSISPIDFLVAQISSGQCVGSIFVYYGSSDGPGWVVGDTFLKNVYSVFRANPPSIGFAALAAGVEGLVTENGVPTPTIGSASVSVTGDGRSGSSSSRPTGHPLARMPRCPAGTCTSLRFSLLR